MLPPSAGAAAAAGVLRTFETGALVLAAFVVGGIAGAVLFARPTGGPQPRVVYIDRPVPQVLESPAPPPDSTAQAMQLPPVEPAHADPAPPAPTAQPSPVKAILAEAPPPEPATHVVQAQVPAPAHASQLAAERTILDEARAAIVQGAPERAIGLLTEHAARFPVAILGEERDAMQVEALAAAGRTAEARAHAEAFRAQRPNSLFLRTVESAIASIPSAP
jgi:hypothetical protein